MSKKLDESSNTIAKCVKRVYAEFTELTDDSAFFYILFLPLVIFIANLKYLKDEECVNIGDAVNAWMRFRLLGGVYTAVAFSICMLLHQVSLLPTEPLITAVIIILAVVLIVAVPSWIIARWARKK